MRCVLLWKWFAVCLSRWYTAPFVSCCTDRENTFTSPEPKLHARSLLPDGHVSQNGYESAAMLLETYRPKKAIVRGSRQRERKEETMKRGTACASGSSGTLTSESITDVFIPLSSPLFVAILLSPHPTAPYSLSSPPPSSSLSMSPMSLPCLHSLSSSISDSPRLLAALPQPLPCL